MQNKVFFVAHSLEWEVFSLDRHQLRVEVNESSDISLLTFLLLQEDVKSLPWVLDLLPVESTSRGVSGRHPGLMPESPQSLCRGGAAPLRRAPPGWWIPSLHLKLQRKLLSASSFWDLLRWLMNRHGEVQLCWWSAAPSCCGLMDQKLTLLIISSKHLFKNTQFCSQNA